MLKRRNLGFDTWQDHTPKDAAFPGIFLPKSLQLKMYKVTRVLKFN